MPLVLLSNDRKVALTARFNSKQAISVMFFLLLGLNLYLATIIFAIRFLKLAIILQVVVVSVERHWESTAINASDHQFIIKIPIGSVYLFRGAVLMATPVDATVVATPSTFLTDYMLAVLALNRIDTDKFANSANDVFIGRAFYKILKLVFELLNRFCFHIVIRSILIVLLVPLINFELIHLTNVSSQRTFSLAHSGYDYCLVVPPYMHYFWA